MSTSANKCEREYKKKKSAGANDTCFVGTFTPCQPATCKVRLIVFRRWSLRRVFSHSLARARHATATATRIWPSASAQVLLLCLLLSSFILTLGISPARPLHPQLCSCRRRALPCKLKQPSLFHLYVLISRLHCGSLRCLILLGILGTWVCLTRDSFLFW